MNRSIFFLMSCISIWGMQPKLHSHDNAVFGPYIPYLIGFASFATGVFAANYLPKIQYKSQLAQEVNNNVDLQAKINEKDSKIKYLKEDLNASEILRLELDMNLRNAKSTLELRETELREERFCCGVWKKSFSSSLKTLFPFYMKQSPDKPLSADIETIFYAKMNTIIESSLLMDEQKETLSGKLMAEVLSLCIVENAFKAKGDIAKNTDVIDNVKSLGIDYTLDTKVIGSPGLTCDKANEELAAYVEKIPLRSITVGFK